MCNQIKLINYLHKLLEKLLALFSDTRVHNWYTLPSEY